MMASRGRSEHHEGERERASEEGRVERLRAREGWVGVVSEQRVLRVIHTHGQRGPGPGAAGLGVASTGAPRCGTMWYEVV